MESPGLGQIAQINRMSADAANTKGVCWLFPALILEFTLAHFPLVSVAMILVSKGKDHLAVQKPRTWECMALRTFLVTAL